MSEVCCVPNCKAEGTHRRVFVIDLEGWGGQTQTDSQFCCKHIDMLNNEEEPFLDLTVIGKVRGS